MCLLKKKKKSQPYVLSALEVQSTGHRQPHLLRSMMIRYLSDHVKCQISKSFLKIILFVLKMIHVEKKSIQMANTCI